GRAAADVAALVADAERRPFPDGELHLAPQLTRRPRRVRGPRTALDDGNPDNLSGRALAGESFETVLLRSAPRTTPRRLSSRRRAPCCARTGGRSRARPPSSPPPPRGVASPLSHLGHGYPRNRHQIEARRAANGAEQRRERNSRVNLARAGSGRRYNKRGSAYAGCGQNLDATRRSDGREGKTTGGSGDGAGGCRS